VDWILRELAAGLESLSPTPAVYQDAIEQTSYQSQVGFGAAVAQTQSLSQISDQLQVVGADAEVGLAGAASNELVNQTAQGIWQLQIGCLVFCQETSQYQRAEQFNSTLQAVFATPAAAAGALADRTAQLIWQVQIGCLAWCDDATELQIASAHNQLERMPAAPPSQPGSPVPFRDAAASPASTAGAVAPSSGPAVPGAAGPAGSAASPTPILRGAFGQQVGRGSYPKDPPARSWQVLVPQGRRVAAPPSAVRAGSIAYEHATPGKTTRPRRVLLSALDASRRAASGAITAAGLAAIAALAALLLGGLCVRYVGSLRDSRSPAA
jgi:hypothetical protein